MLEDNKCYIHYLRALQTNEEGWSAPQFTLGRRLFISCMHTVVLNLSLRNRVTQLLRIGNYAILSVLHNAGQILDDKQMCRQTNLVCFIYRILRVPVYSEISQLFIYTLH